ncbi:MAG TPA: plastocyanin/azurin family copper-binding protein [Tepidisphaeraceae bacterium]|nr:plastocyanin/azurin family copper-binding protein [Tepidisphaeraceae bacterium]
MARFNLGLGLSMAAGIAAGAMLGGCASPPDHAPGQPAPSAVVDMHLHSFEPKTVTILAGEAVLWRNTSFISHTVTADPALAEKPEDVALPPGAQPFNSGNIKSGDVFEKVFTVPGTYKYFCIPHEHAGMLGEVVVKP